MCHKARLVIGLHVTNAERLDKYAATTNLDGVQLQLFLCTDFGANSGLVQVMKSLYGLITSSHSWYEALKAAIIAYDLHPSEIMKCLWYQNVKYGIAYEKLSHHVDDFLHPSGNFPIFMDHLRKKYRITVVNSRL